MSRLEDAKQELKQTYEKHGVEIVIEAMEIIGKYSGQGIKELVENAKIDDLQSDALRLTALNFYLSSIASNLDATAGQAVNRRKFNEAFKWDEIRKEDLKIKQGEVDKKAEIAIETFRYQETEALRKAKIVSAAVESIIEMVNMLKKVVERIMWEGPAGGKL